MHLAQQLACKSQILSSVQTRSGKCTEEEPHLGPTHHLNDSYDKGASFQRKAAATSCQHYHHRLCVRRRPKTKLVHSYLVYIILLEDGGSTFL